MLTIHTNHTTRLGQPHASLQFSIINRKNVGCHITDLMSQPFYLLLSSHHIFPVMFIFSCFRLPLFFACDDAIILLILLSTMGRVYFLLFFPFLFSSSAIQKKESRKKGFGASRGGLSELNGVWLLLFSSKVEMVLWFRFPCLFCLPLAGLWFISFLFLFVLRSLMS